MKDDDLFARFERAQQGVAPEVIADTAKHFAIDFPSDYVAFMRQSNGGEGFVGSEGYLQLWPVETLAQNNADYQAARFYPGHILIGSNGAGEADALLVVKLDRLTRSVRDLGHLVEKYFAPGPGPRCFRSGSRSTPAAPQGGWCSTSSPR